MTRGYQSGFLLLQSLIALTCVSIALSLLLTLHVKSLRHQHTLQSQAWTLIHATSATHIQRHPTASAQDAWEKQRDQTLPNARSNIHWQPDGAITICWEGSPCWQLK